MASDQKFLLDASTLLRLLQDKPVAERVYNLLQEVSSGKHQILMHIMNLSEVIYVIAKEFWWELSQ